MLVQLISSHLQPYRQLIIPVTFELVFIWAVYETNSIQLGEAATDVEKQDDPFEASSFAHIKVPMEGNAELGSSPSAAASGPSGGPEPQEPGHQSRRCLTFEELMNGHPQAGPWMEAFSIVDADLGDLSGKPGQLCFSMHRLRSRIAIDIIGNILELYNFAGQPGIAEVLRVNQILPTSNPQVGC